MNPVQLAVPPGLTGLYRAVFNTEVLTADHGDRVGEGVADVHAVDNDVLGIPALDGIRGQTRGRVPLESAAALVSGQVRDGHMDSAVRRDDGITARWPLRGHKAGPRLDNRRRAGAAQRDVAAEHKMAADQESTSGQGHHAAPLPGGDIDGALDRRRIVTSARPVSVRHGHPGGGPRAMAGAREAARRDQSGRRPRSAGQARGLNRPDDPGRQHDGHSDDRGDGKSWVIPPDGLPAPGRSAPSHRGPDPGHWPKNLRTHAISIAKYNNKYLEQYFQLWYPFQDRIQPIRPRWRSSLSAA